jgi:hypothetical protein
MESVNEIKKPCRRVRVRRPSTSWRSEGRKRVRLIRAEHVAAMISEAVHAAIEQSGLIAPTEVEKLVEKSRIEFRSILREREQELQRAHDNEQALEEREQELAALRQSLGRADARARARRARPSRPRCGPRPRPREPRALEAAHRGRQPWPPAGGPSSDLLLSLCRRWPTLKANLMHQQAAPHGRRGGRRGLSAALEKLTGSLTDRLEKLGKKMGVSAAVESDAPVDFGGLFKDTGKKLESNMDNIEVKQKAGGGIAANLARLKKLKGGG